MWHYCAKQVDIDIVKMHKHTNKIKDRGLSSTLISIQH